MTDLTKELEPQPGHPLPGVQALRDPGTFFPKVRAGSHQLVIPQAFLEPALEQCETCIPAYAPATFPGPPLPGPNLLSLLMFECAY